MILELRILVVYLVLFIRKQYCYQVTIDLMGPE